MEPNDTVLEPHDKEVQRELLRKLITIAEFNRSKWHPEMTGHVSNIELEQLLSEIK